MSSAARHLVQSRQQLAPRGVAPAAAAARGLGGATLPLRYQAARAARRRRRRRRRRGSARCRSRRRCRCWRRCSLAAAGLSGSCRGQEKTGRRTVSAKPDLAAPRQEQMRLQSNSGGSHRHTVSRVTRAAATPRRSPLQCSGRQGTPPLQQTRRTPLAADLAHPPCSRTRRTPELGDGAAGGIPGGPCEVIALDVLRQRQNELLQRLHPLHVAGAAAVGELDVSKWGPPGVLLQQIGLVARGRQRRDELLQRFHPLHMAGGAAIATTNVGKDISLQKRFSNVLPSGTKSPAPERVSRLDLLHVAGADVAGLDT